MEKTENQYSKFDFEAFIKKFEQNGGKWILIKNRSDYFSYDGSHLDEKSALKLSTYLAKEIKKQE